MLARLWLSTCGGHHPSELPGVDMQPTAVFLLPILLKSMLKPMNWVLEGLPARVEILVQPLVPGLLHVVCHGLGETFRLSLLAWWCRALARCLGGCQQLGHPGTNCKPKLEEHGAQVPSTLGKGNHEVLQGSSSDRREPGDDGCEAANHLATASMRHLDAGHYSR